MAEENIKPIKLMDDYTHTFLYMIIISFIAGYVNTYSFFTRGGVFVCNHTGSLNKIGIAFYDLNPQAFINAFLPILAFIFSAFIVEHLKFTGRDIDSYYWQQKIVAVEFLAFLAVGFIPNSVTPFYVNTFLTFIIGLQFAAFRTMEGTVLNTAVAVGNMRTVGQLLYTMLFINKTKEYRQKTLRYFSAFLMFAFSSYISAVVSNILGVKSIWLCLPLLAFLFFKHLQIHKAFAAQTSADEVTENLAEAETAEQPQEENEPEQDEEAASAPSENSPEEKEDKAEAQQTNA